MLAVTTDSALEARSFFSCMFGGYKPSLGCQQGCALAGISGKRILLTPQLLLAAGVLGSWLCHISIHLHHPLAASSVCLLDLSKDICHWA